MFEKHTYIQLIGEKSVFSNYFESYLYLTSFMYKKSTVYLCVFSHRSNERIRNSGKTLAPTNERVT